MKNTLYFFILIRIIVFFGSIAITSEVFRNAHEILGDTYIDMDDQSNWSYTWNIDERIYEKERSCNISGCMSVHKQDHWHWSWMHWWIFWGSFCIVILNLVSIIMAITKKAHQYERL